MSGIGLPDCSKLAVILKNDNVTIWWNDVIVDLFWHCFVSLVRFSYFSKFHVNVITGSGVTTILFYKGLTRNPEIRNPLVSVSPNIWRVGWVMDTKFGMNLSNEVNAPKCQDYSFYHFWVVKRKPTGGGLPPQPD